jgi:M6 family metalloprotease-like protein
LLLKGRTEMKTRFSLLALLVLTLVGTQLFAAPLNPNTPIDQLTFFEEQFPTESSSKEWLSQDPKPLADYNQLVLLVEFNDRLHAANATHYDTLYFGNSAPSCKTYFMENSYNQFVIGTPTLPSAVGWTKLDTSISIYLGGSYPDNAQKMAEDLFDAVDGSVDFSQFDNNSDGRVDGGVVIVYPLKDSAAWHPGVSSCHSPVPYLDGVYIDYFTVVPEYWGAPYDWAIGTPCHEMAHLYGAYGTYGTGGEMGFGLGQWCTMAYGCHLGTYTSCPCHLSAWVKKQIGFITPIILEEPATNLSVIKAESTAANVYELWLDDYQQDEYFLVENRQKVGYDSYLPGDGLMIYHIDESVGNFSTPWWPGQDSTKHYMVAVEPADSLWELEKSLDHGDTGDPFPRSTSNTTWNANSTPNSNTYTIGPSGVAVTNISSSGAVMTVDITVNNWWASWFVGKYDDYKDYKDVWVSGNYAYAADFTNGLKIINISDPEDPTLQGELNTSGTDSYRCICVSGDYAYLGMGSFWNKKMEIINISNPSSPSLTATFTCSGDARDIHVVGNYAYIACNDAGLQIVNVSNPASPSSVGSYDTPGYACGVYVDGSYAYVADGDPNYLLIIDISNPASPTLKGSKDLGSGFAQGVYVSGSYAYVADGDAGLQIVNVSKPNRPSLKGTCDTQDNALGVYVYGDYAYVADGGSGLQIIDVSSATSPSLTATYYEHGLEGYASNVFLSGDYIYVADGYYGTVVVDFITSGPGKAVAPPVPSQFTLNQNYPNPFNPTTLISFSLDQPAETELVVYNLLGQKVSTLVNGHLEAGEHSVIWDGKDKSGNPVASGVYFYTILSDNNFASKKMTLVR